MNTKHLVLDIMFGCFLGNMWESVHIRYQLKQQGMILGIFSACVGAFSLVVTKPEKKTLGRFRDSYCLVSEVRESL